MHDVRLLLCYTQFGNFEKIPGASRGDSRTERSKHCRSIGTAGITVKKLGKITLNESAKEFHGCGQTNALCSTLRGFFFWALSFLPAVQTHAGLVNWRL